MENQKHRKPTTSKLKRILHCKSNVSPLPPLGKDLGHTMKKAAQISPPFLQHSTNTHSLASPLRSSFEIDHHPTGKTPSNDLYQPLSPPSSASRHPKTRQSRSSSKSNDTRWTSACTTKKSHSSTTMTSPTVIIGTTTPHGRRSSSLHYNNRPLWNQASATTSAPPLPPPLPSMTLKKTHTDGSIVSHNWNTANNVSKKTTATTKKDSRRHSCSSTTQDHQRNQRSRMLQEAKKTPLATPTASKFTKTSSSQPCSVLFSKASPAANAALAASSSPLPSSMPQQQSYRRQCPPPLLSLEKSRSTPLRSLTKVKTYNVSPTTAKQPTPQRSTSSSLSSPNKRRSQRPDATILRTERDSERKRRQQELEDLISGRRGSTLKLSLTPQNTLLN